MFVAIFMPIGVAACGNMNVEKFAMANLPISVEQYDYANDESPKFKFKGYENYSMKVKRKEFYVEKKIPLSAELFSNPFSAVSSEADLMSSFIAGL